KPLKQQALRRIHERHRQLPRSDTRMRAYGQVDVVGQEGNLEQSEPLFQLQGTPAGRDRLGLLRSENTVPLPGRQYQMEPQQRPRMESSQSGFDFRLQRIRVDISRWQLPLRVAMMITLSVQVIVHLGARALAAGAGEIAFSQQVHQLLLSQSLPQPFAGLSLELTDCRGNRILRL